MPDISSDAQHLNAGRDLPPGLCRELQEAVGGRATYVWIPSRAAEEARERAGRVVALRRRGRSARDIAAEVGLSERRIYQIVREADEPRHAEAR